MTANHDCLIYTPDLSQIEVVSPQPTTRVADLTAAMTLAKAEAARRFAEYMLVSWYDRDRDFEAPPNTSECAKAGHKTGYILYGLSHGAKLKVDIEAGRFVFFFAPVEW